MKLRPRWFARSDPAARWFARIQSSQVDAREDKAFTDWLEANAHNAEQYDANELAWGLSLELRDRAPIARLIDEAVRDLDTRSSGRSGTRWLRRTLEAPRLVIGAAVLALVTASTAYLVMNRTAAADYGTRVGEQRVVTLEDGSTVTLNTATQIHVEYSRHLRSIDLIRGEALFAVRPANTRPFVVLALGGSTTAVGTEFAVEMHGTLAAVSVLEGTVAVVPPVAQRSSEPAVRLSVGQAVDYGRDGTLGELHNAQVERIRAWQANRIFFANERLAEAIEEYNRYDTRPIVLAAPELANRRVDGVFRVGDQEAFIHALERALPLRAKRSETSITLVPQ